MSTKVCEFSKKDLKDISFILILEVQGTILNRPTTAFKKDTERTSQFELNDFFPI